MNPRYLAYCTALGLTPEQERASVDGHSMHGFVLWMSERRQEYCVSKGLSDSAFAMSLGTDAGHDEYTAWLQVRAVELAGA